LPAAIVPEDRAAAGREDRGREGRGGHVEHKASCWERDSSLQFCLGWSLLSSMWSIYVLVFLYSQIN